MKKNKFLFTLFLFFILSSFSFIDLFIHNPVFAATLSKSNKKQETSNKKDTKNNKSSKTKKKKSSKTTTSKQTTKPSTGSQKIFNPTIPDIDLSTLTQEDIDRVEIEGGLTVEQAAALGKVPVEEIEKMVKIRALYNKEFAHQRRISLFLKDVNGKLRVSVGVPLVSLHYDEDDKVFEVDTRVDWLDFTTEYENTLWQHQIKQLLYINLHQFGFNRSQCEEIYVISLSANKYRSKFSKTYNLSNYTVKLTSHIEGVYLIIKKK